MQQSNNADQPRGIARGLGHWLWLGPLLYITIVSLYFVARYTGHWAEADSATFTKLIRAFVDEGRLAPDLGPVYPNGYSFQAISAFIIALTGLDVVTLQQVAYPLVVPMVALPAWVLYRELTGSARGAAIATVLLFSQPEFLFVVMRSSHEKFTRSLMLLCVFLLVRSLRLGDRPRALAVHVGLFYLAAFAFIASNNLLASSFIFSTAIALVLGRALERRNTNLQRSHRVLQRLQYVTLICVGLAYIFTFYAYPPAQHDVLVLKTVWDRIAALFLDVQAGSGQTYTDAYGVVATGWVSVGIYFLVSIANWIVLAASAVLWLRQGFRWFWLGKAPETPAAWALWLLYAAFAAQGALSVVADASGALSSNLQHRLFPSFSIFAVAVAALALDHWRPRHLARAVGLSLSIAVFCVAILSVFKATNEPLVSNKWTFYRPSELVALDWTDAHLEDSAIWTEYDERLVVAFDTAKGSSTNRNRFQGYGMQPTTRNVVLTTVTRLRSSRLNQPLPVPPDALRVYDNGEAEVYHLRPQTPYQP